MRVFTEKRFWAYVEKTEGCWNWVGSKRQEYGVVTKFGKTYPAHRISYELVIGKIPDGLVLDHLCRNTICVNPHHLEPVTHEENIRRGKPNAAAINAKKTHCVNGHAFNKENTKLLKSGHRACRECCRKSTYRWYHSKRKLETREAA